MIENSFKEIFNRISCNTGLIFVDTPEETRLIREIYREFINDKVNFWSIRYGLHEINKTQYPDTFLPSSNYYIPENSKKGKNKKYNSNLGLIECLKVIEEECREKVQPDKEPEYKNIYVLRDADKFFSQPALLRALRDMIYLASTASSTIICTGYGLTVPTDLEKDSVFIKLNYPTAEEIKQNIIPNVRMKIEEHNNDPILSKKGKIKDNFDEDKVIRACLGLTEEQIYNTFEYTTEIDKEINIDKILAEKKNIIDKSSILEYWICDETMDDAGGFGEFKEWMKEIKTVNDNPDSANELGIQPAKGVLLLGVQGSGKTLIAKAAAKMIGTGVIKFETSKVFAGLVGESIAPWEELTFYSPSGKVTRLSIEDAWKKEDWLIDNKFSVQSYDNNGNVKLLPVSGVISHKRTKDLVRVTTKSGRSVDVTMDHSLFTISDDGKMIEMSPSEMKKGSIIAVPSNYEQKNNISLINILEEIVKHKDENKWLVENPLEYLGDKVYDYVNLKSKSHYKKGRPLNLSSIPKEELNNVYGATIRSKFTKTKHNSIFKINEDIAELMGWYTAEGSTTFDRLRLHVHKNEVNILENLIEQCGYNHYNYRDRDSEGSTIFFGDTGLKRIFDYMNITNKDRIPEIILSLDKDKRRAYIRGLFSGDGGTSGKHIEISQSRKSIIDDILGLLASVGIFASSYPRLDGGYRIVIHSSLFKKKYIDYIGFTQPIKKEIVNETLRNNNWEHKVPFFKKLKNETSSHNVNKNSEWISYKNAIKYDKSEIIKNYDIYWDVVDNIEILENQPKWVYDISVPGNENFIAGNIICHNSEKNMRQALTQLEAVGGVAILDEIDKSLAGAGSSDRTDGGTTSRVIGYLLSWLQESHPGVFLIATANDIESLLNNHPELLRKGRFDEIWFSDAPNEEERKEIFKIHLRKIGRDPNKFKIDELAKIKYISSSGEEFPYTGAEIEYAITDTNRSNFAKNEGKTYKIGSKKDFKTEDISKKFEDLIPISYLGREGVSRMKEFASTRARNVSKKLISISNNNRLSINIRRMNRPENSILTEDFDI